MARQQLHDHYIRPSIDEDDFFDFLSSLTAKYTLSRCCDQDDQNKRSTVYGDVFIKTAEQINDKEGLNKKLKDIKIFEDNWLERLDLISEPAIITPELLHQYGDLDLKVNRKGEISGEELDDPAQNDFKREMLFYRQAQTTVMDGLRRFHNQYNIKNTSRPDDYFAEMLKSDEHMKKVHQKLETRQTTLEASDKAKRQRELKKYGKKVQQEIQLKRQQEKRELLEKIQRYKKGKLDSLDFLDKQDSSGPSTSNKQQMNSKNVKKNGNAKVTKKQRYKETKYGYGGRKKRSKYNSSQSAADMSTFSAHYEKKDGYTFPLITSQEFIKCLYLSLEYLCLYNHLPLIICPLVNMRKQRQENSMTMSSSFNEDHRSKSGLVDNLILLVYENQGYLFVCCPRISQKSQSEFLKTNHDHCDVNEKLLLQEPNISLSYTILHMISSMFFAKNKSLRSLELFISSYMPFGTLIKTKSDQDILLLSKLYPKDTAISIRLTESISTSFQSDETNIPDNETIFGTLTINYIGTKYRSSTKSDIVLNIENLHSITLVLPTNCSTNESSLIYDINNRNQYNLNIVHYKTNNNQDDDNNGYKNNRSSNEWKFFQTKYTIHRKSSPGQQKQQQQQSFINSNNIHHINLIIWINDKISLFDDIKFKYFLIKFSLNRGQSKKQVQTIGNSINNLIIRDSVKISQGQLKNEQNSLVWMIGNRLSRATKKLSIDFDLVIDRDNLKNLDTQCTFNHTVQFRTNLHYRSNRPLINNNTSMMIRNQQLFESKIQPPINMIPSYLRLSKIAMIISEPMITSQQQQQQSSTINESNEYCNIEYNLNSYEYRLYPSIIDSNV
ncbi:putative rRNA-processing protein EBP2 [Dermatophagoides pteronyssinus]|uniref:rRNA-processing protein EBP2 n=1 Tax=Dermatophagoides pteronyssinus TaxID=6956 RepID=A0ABQ8IQX0_DERPT|nr:putative rRNA-processing protein EBP2 [Dermatophagoides pteronyssinus]